MAWQSDCIASSWRVASPPRTACASPASSRSATFEPGELGRLQQSTTPPALAPASTPPICWHAAQPQQHHWPVLPVRQGTQLVQVADERQPWRSRRLSVSIWPPDHEREDGKGREEQELLLSEGQSDRHRHDDVFDLCCERSERW